MKKIVFFLLLVSSLAQAQESAEQIRQLENSKKQISEKILLLNDSIKKIEFKINILKSKEFQKNISDSSLIAIARKGAKIKRTPDVMGELILTLEEDKQVVILDYHNEFFGACAGSICGYMSDIWIKSNDKIAEFVKIKKQQEEEIERLKKERKLKKQVAEDAKNEKDYLKKYGKVVYEKLKKGYYWVGMTREMALISLGSPTDNNRSVGSWGVHEQWVYNSGLYLYFENGKLKSYQD